jgi:2-methylcitrate dehydratase PrpD
MSLPAKHPKKPATAISPLMRKVSAYIAGASKKPLPAAVVEKTKHHLLDSIASMISGSRLLPGQHALRYIKTLGGTPEACIPGSKIVTTVVNAALAGGMLAHADETDDSHAPSLTHPGCGIVPAALAMAEKQKARRSRWAATRLALPGATRTRWERCSEPPPPRVRWRGLMPTKRDI